MAMKKILEKRAGPRVAALLILSALCACGQKGPLYLEKAEKAGPAPAASAAPGAAAASGSSPSPR